MRDVWGPMLTAETFSQFQALPYISAKYKSENKDFTLKEIISTVFVKLKETAEDFLSTRINNAVVTIPACFNNVQCQAIRDAGLIAGLNVLYIIIGSTAAAISYWLNKRLTEVQNILVFDFGSITLDVSLLTIELGFFKIVAITSDAHLVLNQDLFQSTMEVIEKVLRDAKIDKSLINEIILISYSLYIPNIQRILSEFFNGKELNKSINPNEAAAYGAAIQAAILSDDTSKKTQDLLLIDTIPSSFSIETLP
ncbi:hypothetical protein RclHR1_17290001 [Rhizophagus clarus]|uniref:Uncharacterized protein n=2 Tax=Rhizophagus clarus TaxID=94130 RepID=A0A2Z6RCU4_9GLOM|nr:hypothetical protein RclHR1_17290001 [Rhizophagus clarus]